MPRPAQYPNLTQKQPSTTDYESLFYHPAMVSEVSKNGAAKVESQNEMIEFHQHMMQAARHPQRTRSHRFSVKLGE